MNKYKFAIEERLVRIVEVTADSLEAAAQQVKDEYYSGDIILDADDFKDVRLFNLQPTDDSTDEWPM